VRIDLARLVRVGLFACLAVTFYKGFLKLPEVFPVLDPERFYRGQVNDGENTLIMKERHFDFNYQTGKAVELRLEELRALDENPPDDVLANRERVELALAKTLAKDVRNADYVVLAEEKLERARLRQARGWSLGWSGAPAGAAGPGAATPDASPGRPGLTGGGATSAAASQTTGVVSGPDVSRPAAPITGGGAP